MNELDLTVELILRTGRSSYTALLTSNTDVPLFTPYQDKSNTRRSPEENGTAADDSRE